MVRLAMSALLLITLACSSGCCLLQEFWYAFPGRHCSAFNLSPCLKGYDCKHGCGEVYWGELSDPPCVCGDCCDQCGHWGGNPTYAGYLPQGHRTVDYAHADQPQNYVQRQPSGTQIQRHASVNRQVRHQNHQVHHQNHQSLHQQSERYPLPNTSMVGNVPTDADMQLPAGAKILSRSDRIVGEGEAAPAPAVASRPEPSVRTTRYQQPARRNIQR